MPGLLRNYVPHLSLGAMVVIWGGSYPVVVKVLEQLPPFLVIATRFWIATLCMLLLTRNEPRGSLRRSMAPGLLTGLALGLGYNLQTFGLQSTSASMGGFIAGLIVPLVAIGGRVCFGATFGRWSLLGIGCAVAGMSLLCSPNPSQQDSAFGIALQFGAILSYVCHIMLLSRFGKSLPTGAFCTWQMLVTALLGTVCMPFSSEPNFVAAHWTTQNLWLMAYLALLASALGVAVQSRVQHRIASMHLAVLFALQPLFAALFGWLTLNEQLSSLQLLGGGIIVLGVILTSMQRTNGS